LPGESGAPTRDMDRFGEPIRTVVSTAAVIGDEFEVTVLAAATALDSTKLLAHLKELDRAGFIARVDDHRYRFTDAASRKDIYEGLGAGLRCRLHQRIGEAIEQLYGTDSDTYIEELAHHFSQGITPETTRKAVDYLIRAGEKVLSLKGFDRAGSYWRAALKVMPSSGAMADLRARALLRLNDELVSSGPEAVAYLEEAIAPLESLKSKSWIGYTHARLGYFFSAPLTGAELNIPRAMAHFDSAESLLQAPKDRKKLAELFQ
jgi:predicted ATPase